MNAADTAYAVFTAMAGVFGALFGSFLNVCILRIPEDRSIVWPGSACPACGTPIRAYDNVPVLAWLWLRGRCRACSAPISPMYPAIEALAGVLAMLLFRRIVPDIADLDTAHLVAFGWYGWLLFALLAGTFIDLRHSILPDGFTILMVPVGVAGAALLGHLGYPHAPTWQQSVVGALVGGATLGAVSGIAWLIYRYEAMGLGDAKLLAMLGAFFGALPAVPFILFTAATVGSLVGVTLALARGRGLRTAMPFGPFLALGATVWLFAGNAVTVRFVPLLLPGWAP
ncbi:MAG: type prepilin-like protein leader peptide processing enzyme [Pseudomonadota bacterium]|jgi:leader peptidase (prepilin peptidase)/N-methyltransferase